MAKHTREDILRTAKRLFGERGYNAVSMGDIAGELNISKGNLTYYFRKKENIIEDLLREARLEESSVPAASLEELNTQLIHMQQVVEENAFYFRHHAQLAQISPEILGMQQKAVAYNQESLAASFRSLEERRLLSFPSDEARSCLINTILITTIYWLPYSKLANDGNRPFLEQLWSGILPYLTDQGLQDYLALVGPKRPM